MNNTITNYMSYRCEHGKDSDICVQCWEERNLEPRIMNEPTPLQKVIDFKIDLAEGKYTYIRYLAGEQEALRYGEPWRKDLAGDNLIYYFGCKVEEQAKQLSALQKENEGLKTKLVIAEQTVDDLRPVLDTLLSTRAENARMREALKHTTDCFCSEHSEPGDSLISGQISLKTYFHNRVLIALSTPCKHLKVTDGHLGDEGHVVICNDCGQDLAPNRSTTTTDDSKEDVK